MTSHTPDDGFHEIQLNGKQLVFLFMAATVVSVVIFLCGVLVGRGVRAERGGPDSASLVDVPIVDQTPAPTTGAGSDLRSASPPPPVSDLTYTDRLEKPDAVQETLKPAAPRPLAPDTSQTARAAEPPPVAVTPPAKPPATTPPVKPASTKPTPAPVAAPPPPAAAPARAASSPAGGKQAFSVQLAALNSRGEAETMAKRLSAKGYEAYIQDPAAGAPSIFRVRVGNYPTRGEAESVAAKIEKEGQFKPWVAPR